MWNPDEYLEYLYASIQPEFSFIARSKEDWFEWRSALKDKFSELLGHFPSEKVELSPIVLERKVFESYVRERIEYTVDAHLRVPAYLLIPKHRSGPLPAVIACHGHGYGSREIVGLWPDGSENTSAPGIHKNFALELVKKGFVVLAPEILGFGDRRLLQDQNEDPRVNSCYRLSMNLLMMGRTLAGQRVFELQRAVDYLIAREDVANEQIGCMGLSGGGLICAFASAIDERIKAVVLSGFVNTFKGSVLSMRHCADNYIPGILPYAEMPDLIGLIAPRPLFIETGMEDHVFPLDSALEAISQLKRIYGMIGATSALETDIFPGTHEIWGKNAYDWLEIQLTSETRGMNEA
ncbi:dienelactone hydrolase family protein [Ammoniphilus sp. 3BR4]|uniref:dienelactone hydrolase family protein n=1 Tax=Ammoniphilus sp. 3BR4 TaxID=3158265 RepID=UPI003466CC21